MNSRALGGMACFAALVVGACVPAQADPAAYDVGGQSRETGALGATYGRYARAVRRHGGVGVREFAASGFLLHWAGGTLRGSRAFDDMGKYLDGYQHGKFTINIRRLAVHGDNAVAWTQETATDATGTGGVSSMTWLWRQAWHRTPGGWKMTVSDRVDSLPSAMPAVTYTVSSGEVP